jgi:hypothetical protein
MCLAVVLEINTPTVQQKHQRNRIETDAMTVQSPPPTMSRTSGDEDILDSTGYCLLSLDGGGVRGLATLYILQRTMKELNIKRKAKGLGPKKPCDIFDLIGGTSTGG